jgi:hypothetical protein
MSLQIAYSAKENERKERIKRKSAKKLNIKQKK